jgi:hypothetical protein
MGFFSSSHTKCNVCGGNIGDSPYCFVPNTHDGKLTVVICTPEQLSKYDSDLQEKAVWACAGGCQAKVVKMLAGKS